jgi:hypothetical protein
MLVEFSIGENYRKLSKEDWLHLPPAAGLMTEFSERKYMI